MDLRIEYTSNEFPVKIAKRYGRATMYYVPYGIVENDGIYTFKYVSVQPDYYNYGGLIDAIISTKYEMKDEMAVVNNYLLNPENEAYIEEYNEFQNWRQFAKSEAKKHFNL